MAHNTNDTPKPSRTLSESHKRQIELLKILSGYKLSNPKEGKLEDQVEIKQYEISEIAQMSSFGDETEIQRYLLILEGQKLVSPLPEGDFTSTRWKITPEGLKAMRNISKSALLN